MTYVMQKKNNVQMNNQKYINDKCWMYCVVSTSMIYARGVTFTKLKIINYEKLLIKNYKRKIQLCFKRPLPPFTDEHFFSK